jgi:hypothetical protein
MKKKLKGSQTTDCRSTDRDFSGQLKENGGAGANSYRMYLEYLQDFGSLLLLLCRIVFVDFWYVWVSVVLSYYSYQLAKTICL